MLGPHLDEPAGDVRPQSRQKVDATVEIASMIAGPSICSNKTPSGDINHLPETRQERRVRKQRRREEKARKAASASIEVAVTSIEESPLPDDEQVQRAQRKAARAARRIAKAASSNGSLIQEDTGDGVRQSNKKRKERI